MNLGRSEQIHEIAAALAKAQGKIEGASKDKQNPHLKNRYADLASAWDACRAALSENGISVVQAPGDGDAGAISVTTLLMHQSGQWLEGRLSMRPAKGDPQSIGSVITYARRYSLMAMVGIAPEDDDGNAAAGRSHDQQQQQSPQQQVAPRDREGHVPMVEEIHNAVNEIRRAIDQCNDLGALNNLYADRKATMAKIRTADEAAFKAVMSYFTARKAEIEASSQAAE